MFQFGPNPFQEFERELKKAVDSGLTEPTAMSLATIQVGDDLKPKAKVRTVLFKGLVRQGFSFYTNYTSPKSKQLLATPSASLLFLWTPLEQQIRLEGQVEKLTRAESEAYFKTRPRLSQLGAWASSQSERIKNYEELQAQYQKIEDRFQGKDVPCPEHWGGFRLVPDRFEFWFGKPGRLHERFVYQLQGTGWDQFMISP